ncbi:MAG: hypothetical protein HFI21_16940 [Lachnospiraceae bacterium]|uniref:GDSL-type esterase/lipase family protein n=1 Tax=Candidatus Merdisoma sp. JLR.KK011 TaxID=3114299 RepID=UPI002FF2C72D|nr:hypothetical protein [Lachnospiraceae bacterium]
MRQMDRRSKIFISLIISLCCNLILICIISFQNLRIRREEQEPFAQSELSIIIPAIIKEAQKYDYYTNSQYNAYVSMFSLYQGKSDVIFAGDSLTARGNFGEFFEDISLLNRGIGSDISAGLLARIDEIIVHQPSKVFIMIGINDIARGIDKKVTRNNISEIIKKIHFSLPDCQVYIESVLPTQTEYEWEILQLNKELQDVALKSECIYIDIYAHFLDENGEIISNKISIDGTHLNGEGYKTWVETIKEYVNSN